MAPGGESGKSADGVRLHLLGGLRVERAGAVVPDAVWHRPRAKALVKLLAVTPGHQLLRDQVIDALWPNLDIQSADVSFRKALSWARHALEPELGPRAASSYIHLSGNIVTLDQGVWIDADAFESAATHALASKERQALEDALDLYGGELLPEDLYEEWGQERRRALAELHTQLLLQLARVQQMAGQLEDAIVRMRAALRHDAAREDIHRELMRLYALAGSRQRALHQYRVCCRTLRQTYDVDPEPETVALYESIRAGELRAAETIAPTVPAALLQRSQVRFVGRERPRELLLKDLFGDTDSPPERPVLIVGGEAGVGKSRLVAEVARIAARNGALVLWGASYEQEGQLPYGAIVEALNGYISTLPDRERLQLGECYPALRRVLPGISSSDADAPTLQTESNRMWLFATMSRFLTDLRREQKVLLVLDDLHNADPPTLQLAHYLARQALEHRALMVATVREEDVAPGSELADLLASMSRLGMVRRLTLLPLAREECDSLARSLLPGGEPDLDLLDHVFRLSLGNPLFSIELVHELREHGAVLNQGVWTLERIGDQDLPAHVPGQVRDLLVARVERMREGTLRALGLAAVAGMEWSFSLLARAAGHAFSRPPAEDDLLDSMEEAVGAWIVEERDDGYAFRHPLFRAALYQRLSEPRRARLHLALGRGLEQLNPDEVEALAYHFALSNDNAKACEYLEKAGDRAASVYANDAAELHYRALIERLERSDRADEAARVREKLGTVLITVSRYDEALAVLEPAAEHHRRNGDGEGLGRVAAQIGRIYAFRGETEAGIAYLQPLIQELERREPSSGLAMLHASVAAMHFPGGNYTASADAATRAAEIARSAGDKRVLADALRHLATARGMVGRYAEGASAIEESIALAEEIGDDTALPVSLNNIGHGHLVLGELEQSRIYRERALRAAERVGQQAWIGAATATLGQTQYYLGDWEQARRLAEEALSILQSLGPTWYVAYPLLYLGTLDVAEGRWESAARRLQEATEVASRSRDLQALWWAAVPQTELDLANGRVREAIDRLEHLRDMPDRVGRDSVFTLPYLALAYAEAGEIDTAETVVFEAVDRSTEMQARLYLVDALRVQGILRARRSNWLAAQHVLDEALTLARSMRYPYAEARILYELGLVARGQGDVPEARHRLQAALVIVKRLGARPCMERTREALQTVRRLPSGVS